MSKALIAFTALLGLFSFSSFAQDDGAAICRQKAEYDESANIRFLNASTCSATGVLDRCVVKARPTSTCEQDQFGVWVGINYYYTGCLEGGGTCGGSPDPDPEPDPDPQPPPLTEQLTPISWRIHESTPWQSHGNENAMIVHFSDQVRLSFGYQLKASEALSRNDGIINSNILALSKSINSLGDDVDATRSASELATSAARSARDSAESASDYSFASLNLTRTIEKDLKSLTEQGVKKTDFDELSENIKLNNDAEIVRDTATTEKLDEIYSEALDAAAAAGTAVFNIGALNTDVIRYAREDAERDFDLRNTVINTTSTVTSDINNSLVDTNSTLFIMRNIQAETTSKIDTIYSILTDTGTGEPTDPEDPNPPTGGNADVVEAIDELKDDLEDAIGDLEDPLEEIEYNTSDIEYAVQNVDSTLRSEFYRTNYELGELRSMLDARTQSANESLSGIASAINGLSESGTSQSEQLTNISSGIDGLGESIEGLKNGLEGAPLTEGDFSPEDGILSSLGITGNESISDLTAKPIKVEDYRKQYDTFLTGTCPATKPISIKVAGRTYNIEINNQPFCDFFSHLGSFLLFVTWIAVPSIVFGRRN